MQHGRENVWQIRQLFIGDVINMTFVSGPYVDLVIEEGW